GDEGRSDPPSPGRWIHAQIAEVPAALVVLDRGDAVQAPVSSAMPEPRQGPVRVHHVLPVDLGGPLRPQQRDLALVVVIERVGHGPGDDRGHTRLEGIDSLHTGRLPQRGRGSPHLETIAIGNPSGLRQRFTEAVRGHGDVIDHRRVDLPETGGPGVLDHGSRECHIHGGRVGLVRVGPPAESEMEVVIGERVEADPPQVPAVMGCDEETTGRQDAARLVLAQLGEGRRGIVRKGAEALEGGGYDFDGGTLPLSPSSMKRRIRRTRDSRSTGPSGWYHRSRALRTDRMKMASILSTSGPKLPSAAPSVRISLRTPS